MFNIQKYEDRKRKFRRSLFFTTAAFVVSVFLPYWTVGPVNELLRVVVLFLLMAWVAAYVAYEKASCKLEILKEIQDEESRDKDEAE